MEFIDVITKRKSVRSYLPKEVPEELITEIAQRMERAPSAGDLKAWKAFFLSSPDVRKQIAAAALDQNFLAQAPVVVVFCANPEVSSKKYGERGASFYCLQDATIAAAYCQLIATDLGLATCWVGAFYSSEIQRIAKIPETLQPIALMALGYENI